jgi:hypothetical protein
MSEQEMMTIRVEVPWSRFFPGDVCTLPKAIAQEAVAARFAKPYTIPAPPGAKVANVEDKPGAEGKAGGGGKTANRRAPKSNEK